MQTDLTIGEDVRGDSALFIENSRFNKDGWSFNKETTDFLKKFKEPMFFRVIYDGEEQSSHGWIEKGVVTQWG